MATDLQHTIDELKSLSIGERLRVVAEIWDSLEDDAVEFPLDPEEQAELQRRLDAYEANPGMVLTWDQVLAQLRSKL